MNYQRGVMFKVSKDTGQIASEPLVLQYHEHSRKNAFHIWRETQAKIWE